MVGFSGQYFLVQEHTGDRERKNPRTGHVKTIEVWKDRKRFTFPDKPKSAEAEAKAKAEAFVNGREGFRVKGPQFDFYL